MIIFPPQEFITWTNTLTQFPWPIQLNDFPPYAEKLGWKPTSRPTWFNVLPDKNDEITILSSNEAGDVYKLFLHMATNDADDVECCSEFIYAFRAQLLRAVVLPFGHQDFSQLT